MAEKTSLGGWFCVMVILITSVAWPACGPSDLIAPRSLDAGPTDARDDRDSTLGYDDGGTISADQPLPLPFAVDDAFLRSGYWGTGEQPGGIVDRASATSCGALGRQGTRAGLCHNFTVTLTTQTQGASVVEYSWGGVHWQYPENNWCDQRQRGRLIQPGAKLVSFVAWGTQGGETVTFVVGDEDTTTAGRQCDGFSLKRQIRLTQTPNRYALPLTEATYDDLTTYRDVAVGFGFEVEGLATGPVVFFVDDIQWI